MSYCIEDLDESLRIAGVDRESVARVVWAWGESDNPEYAQCCAGDYECAFALELSNGLFALVEGWCDYTGWGCQDGSDVTYSESEPPIKDGADRDPIDLNRHIRNFVEAEKVV